MSYTDVFGPCVDDDMVGQAWLDLTLKWIHDYLLRVEHANDEAPSTWDRPAHWKLADEARILDEDLTPLLICEVVGEPETPTADADGVVSATARVALAVYCEQRYRDDSSRMCRRYAWAIAALCDQKSVELADICSLKTRPRKTYNEIPTDRDGELAAAYVTFDVDIHSLRSRDGGPATPTPPGQTPSYPDTPDVTTVDVDFEATDSP